jgi:NDP-sugar pyrophosphorylase family protein
MKMVISAGGLGSRLGEETAVRPKPMVEIGGRPIIWHIMKIYSAHGLNEGPQTTWEWEPLEHLAETGELRAYHHDGFWAAMDTLRDKIVSEERLANGAAPWKIW